MSTRKTTIRELASQFDISTGMLSTTMKERRLLEAAGLADEFDERTLAGEKHSEVLADLLPEYAEQKKRKAKAAQFKSAARWMLDNGVPAEALVAFIYEHAGEAQS
jgi:hypothetical protein